MPAPPVIWLPDAVDHLEHAVVDTDVHRAAAAGVAEVVAVCAVSVRLCSLATPAGGRCRECDAVVARRFGPVGDRTGRTRPWWGRRPRSTPA